MKLPGIVTVLIFCFGVCYGQSNLFLNPNEGSGSSHAGGPSSPGSGSGHAGTGGRPSAPGGSAHSGAGPSSAGSGGSHTGGPSSFDPSETVSFDQRMTFSAHTIAGRSSTSQFLVNTEKGYMGMNKQMMEEFSGVEFPDNDAFKVEYRVTDTNGKTYYFVEINGVKQVVNRLPMDEIGVDQTNLSPQKFRDNFSPTGGLLNVSSQNYRSKEYSGISADTGNPVKVYIAEQNNIRLNPADNQKTVGIFGLGYIYHDNKTQMVTRIENDHGTAELERIENTNISFGGNNYRKRENVMEEEESRKREIIEDVHHKKQEDINNMSDSRADIKAKEQEILNLERERERKRKEAANKYQEDGAPAEKNASYALQGFDPKDDIAIRKLECEKRVLEINRILDRISSSNPDYSKLLNEKACQEEKILAYKNAEAEMIAIKERHADNADRANTEKMNYYFTDVVPNIYAKWCP